jgi:DNA (cytosine-5)-methyltransferase 1
LEKLSKLGYQPEWKVLQSADFGVPQLRPRFVLIAMRARDAEFFCWPRPQSRRMTVGGSLFDLMASRGWAGASEWAAAANRIAPTLVGGSIKHGGPDLGPMRAKAQWRELGVDGMGIADECPGADFPPGALPRLTVRMAARIQGFPDSWAFAGKKTVAYRQVGNAFPPPVACAIGRAIRAAFEQDRIYSSVSFEAEVRLLEEPPKSSCHPRKA